MRSYEAARGYFSFLSFVSWCAIIGGGFLAFGAIAAVSKSSFNPAPITVFFAAVPGLILAAVGFFGLIFVQSSRAAVDSAEYGQQALQVSRNQLEVSKQLLKLAEQQEQTTGYTATTTEADLKPVSYDTDAATPDGAAMLAAAAGASEQSISAEPARPALPDFSEHITFESGRYVVEGNRFWTRSEAEAYVKSEVLAPQS